MIICCPQLRWALWCVLLHNISWRLIYKEKDNLLELWHFCWIMQIPNKEKSTVDKILHELLQKGDSAQKYVQGSRGVKVDNWILLDNFVQGHSTSAAQLRALRGNSKRSRNHMSLKQLKKHGLSNLPEEYHMWVFCFLIQLHCWLAFLRWQNLFTLYYGHCKCFLGSLRKLFFRSNCVSTYSTKWQGWRTVFE